MPHIYPSTLKKTTFSKSRYRQQALVLGSPCQRRHSPACDAATLGSWPVGSSWPPLPPALAPGLVGPQAALWGPPPTGPVTPRPCRRRWPGHRATGCFRSACSALAELFLRGKNLSAGGISLSAGVCQSGSELPPVLQPHRRAWAYQSRAGGPISSSESLPS